MQSDLLDNMEEVTPHASYQTYDAPPPIYPTERSSLLSHHAHRRTFLQHRFTEHYHELIQHNREDDAVSIAVKHFLVLITLSILMWLLSYIFIMLQIINHDHFSAQNWPLFIPFWCGSLLGIFTALFISCKVCTNSNLVNREERLFLRSQGLEQEFNFIDYDSLPLMRRLLFWCVVSGLSFTLALVAQLLYYFWFIGLMKMWHALIPIAILLSVYTLYMYVVNIFSLLSCFILTLLFAEVVS